MVACVSQTNPSETLLTGYPRPDFFIAGSFKCGTTALYEYLRPHPGIFMPFHKEPLYFGDDLTRRYGRMSEEQYLALFRESRTGQRVGEASSWLGCCTPMVCSSCSSVARCGLGAGSSPVPSN